MRNTRIFALFLAAALVGPAAAQPHSAGDFVRQIGKGEKDIWTSPLHMKKSDWLKTALPLAAVTASLIATDRNAAQLLPDTPDQIKWGRRVSRAGESYVLGAAAVTPWVIGAAAHKPAASRIGWKATEALIHSGVVVYVLKQATNRERPETGIGKGRFWHGGDSMPSGHAMASFAIAGAVAHDRNCPKWLAVTSYVAAAGIGASRWPARKHFPSDIVMGGTLGYFIGRYIGVSDR